MLIKILYCCSNFTKQIEIITFVKNYDCINITIESLIHFTLPFFFLLSASVLLSYRVHRLKIKKRHILLSAECYWISVKSHKLLGTYTVNYFQTHVILCSVDTLHEFTVLGWYESFNVAWSRSKWFICLHVRLFFFVSSNKQKNKTLVFAWLPRHLLLHVRQSYHVILICETVFYFFSKTPIE